MSDCYQALLQEQLAIEKNAWKILRQKYSDEVIKGALGGWEEIDIIAPSDSPYSPEKYALIVLQSITDVRQSVAKQNDPDLKLDIMKAARAGFDVGLHYLGMNEKRIGRIVDDFKSVQTSGAVKDRHAKKDSAKKRARELAKEHWENPAKKNRLSITATSEDVIKKLQGEKLWNEDCDWKQNAVRNWIKDLPERPKQKSGRKPKINS